MSTGEFPAEKENAEGDRLDSADLRNRFPLMPALNRLHHLAYSV